MVHPRARSKLRALPALSPACHAAWNSGCEISHDRQGVRPIVQVAFRPPPDASPRSIVGASTGAASGVKDRAKKIPPNNYHSRAELSANVARGNAEQVMCAKPILGPPFRAFSRMTGLRRLIGHARLGIVDPALSQRKRENVFAPAIRAADGGPPAPRRAIVRARDHARLIDAQASVHAHPANDSAEHGWRKLGGASGAPAEHHVNGRRHRAGAGRVVDASRRGLPMDCGGGHERRVKSVRARPANRGAAVARRPGLGAIRAVGILQIIGAHACARGAGRQEPIRAVADE